MYICIDESGVFNKNMNNYFIIGGYFCKSIHEIRSVHKKLEKNYKIENNIPLNQKINELKGNNSGYKLRTYFLNGFLEIEGILPFYIVLNLQNDQHLSFLAKNSEKFNYLLKHALDIIFSYQFSSDYQYITEDEEVIIYLDEQNISTSKRFEFEKYLKTYSNFCQHWKNLKKVKYLKSTDFREIQVADFFAHYFWSIENYPQTDKVTTWLNKKIQNSIKLVYPFKAIEIPIETKKINLNGWSITTRGNYGWTAITVVPNLASKINTFDKYFVEDKLVAKLYKFDKDCTITYYPSKSKLMIQGSKFIIKKVCEKLDILWIE